MVSADIGRAPIGDALLLALSDRGDVTWQQFDDICEAVGIEYPRRFARSLDRLGHIEILPRERKQVAVAPAGLVEVVSPATGVEAVFSGARDEPLLSRISDAAPLLGIQVEYLAQGPFPSRIAFRGKSREVLRSLAEALGVVWFGASAIALATRLTVTAVATTVAANLLATCRWFSVDMGKFVETSRPVPPALGELVPQFGARRYFLVQRHDVREIDRNTGIHVLCASSKRPVIQFDADERLRVLAAFPLPRLHERAVVLCSGLEPFEQNGELVYARVPLQMFHTLRAQFAQRLGSE